MFRKSFEHKKKSPAQAMVEFALILPILLLVVYGLLETGRLLVIYASVTTAARQAVRYASATGDNGSGTPRFQDCAGIVAAANSVAFLQPFNTINITYDRGLNSSGNEVAISGINPDPSVANTCPIGNNVISNGDRVKVYVDTQFSPIVPLVPLRAFTITGESSRTIIVSVSIEVTAPPSTWIASTPTQSQTATSTPSYTPTPTYTPSNTPTPLYTPTASNTPTITLTPTVTFTPTNTGTPTSTFTPTNTPSPSSTPILCSPFNIYNTGLTISGNTMSMNITNNTGYILDISQIFVAWNHDDGKRPNDPLALTGGNLGGSFWVGTDAGPSKTFVPSSAFSMPTIPMGPSTVSFSFDGDYFKTDKTETIVITIGTNGCSGYNLTGN